MWTLKMSDPKLVCGFWSRVRSSIEWKKKQFTWKHSL